jgi:hypothetical protein
MRKITYIAVFTNNETIVFPQTLIYMIQQLRKTALLLKILLLLMAIGSSNSCYAQNKTLSNLLEIAGKVTDSRTGSLLPMQVFHLISKNLDLLAIL